MYVGNMKWNILEIRSSEAHLETLHSPISIIEIFILRVR